MFLGRACCSADSVTSGSAAEQEDNVSRHRGLSADLVGLHCSDHCSDFKTLGSVALVVDFPDVCGGKAYLVAVAGVAMGCLAGNDALREFARKCLSHRFVDIACSGHPHCLIYV